MHLHIQFAGGGRHICMRPILPNSMTTNYMHVIVIRISFMVVNNIAFALRLAFKVHNHPVSCDQTHMHDVTN
jgi:hypothetical protein